MSYRKYFGIALLVLLVIWSFVIISAVMGPVGSEKIIVEQPPIISPVSILVVITGAVVTMFFVVEMIHSWSES